jgi:hypothetical protein
MSTPRIHLPPPPPIEFVLLAAALAFAIVSLTSCSGVNANTGLLSLGGNQSAALVETENYYPTGAIKSKMKVENYVSINPNPELTQAAKDLAITVVATKGLVDVTEATVANPNKTPALARDPNTLKRNPNVTVKDVNSIPLNPNVIPK